MRMSRVLMLALPFASLAATGGAAQGRVEKDIVVGTYSGLVLTMDVMYPERSNGIGVVLVVGSGWYRSLDYDAARLSDSPQVGDHGRPLVTAGYTVFVLNHRATPRFRFPAQLEDVQRAVRFVRHHSAVYGIDPDRIGAVGGSSGGHLVLLLGTMAGVGDPSDPDPINGLSAKVQAVAAWFAPSELATMDTPDGREAVALLLGGRLRRSGASVARMARDASPVTHVSSDDSPTLLVHGDADAVVPFRQSTLMHEALMNAGVETRLVAVPGGGHGTSTEDLATYVAATIEWLDHHLR